MPRGAVGFTVTLRTGPAAGALGYRLDFGDGTSRQNAVPQFCLARPRSPEQQTSQLVHRYARAGTYRASLHGRVNCSSIRATATLAVVVP
jgi:hypothetical protein